MLSSEASLTINQSTRPTSQKIRIFNNTAVIASDLTRNVLTSRITCQLYEANWALFYLSFRFRSRRGCVDGIRWKFESRLAKSQLTFQFRTVAFQHGILKRNLSTSVTWSSIQPVTSSCPLGGRLEPVLGSSDYNKRGVKGM